MTRVASCLHRRLPATLIFLHMLMAAVAQSANMTATGEMESGAEAITVTLHWAGDGAVQMAQYAISYDPAVLGPPLLGSCISNNPGDLPAFCLGIDKDDTAPDRVGLTLADLDAPLPSADPLGTVSFPIKPGATGQSLASALSLSVYGCYGGTCLAQGETESVPISITNILVLDSDHDGLSDIDEVARGTDPLLRDSDGDTIPDGEEVELGLDPLDGECADYLCNRSMFRGWRSALPSVLP